MTANRLEELDIQCPYCWRIINVLIDCSIETQEYIEDCQVCCRASGHQGKTTSGLKMRPKVYFIACINEPATSSGNAGEFRA
jgi:hypothetical protein